MVFLLWFAALLLAIAFFFHVLTDLGGKLPEIAGYIVYPILFAAIVGLVLSANELFIATTERRNRRRGWPK